MPIYEYECPYCKNKITKHSAITDEQVMQKCSRCGEIMRRIYSPPTIIYKGSGFYCTDNKKVDNH